MQSDSLSISSTGAGAILALVRSGQATTRAALMAVTGLSRSTIGQRLDRLIQAGYLQVISTTISTGGRPVEALQVNPDYGLLLLAAVGASGFRVAVTDFCGRMLEVHSETCAITAGPDVILSRIRTLFLQLLQRTPQGKSALRGIGIGLPGPIDFVHKAIVQPPIMQGWDNFSVPGFFAADFPVPVLMDNDVNLMALGEHRFSYPTEQDLLYLKLGTGIGSGIVMSGKIQRGALGAAGDLGHWFLPDWRSQQSLRTCRCGKQGCLEAYSSGWALCDEWQVESVRMLMLHADQPALRQRLQAAGVHQGEALAMAINLLNPARVIVGGELLNEPLLASLRETVYLRSGALSTRTLHIDQGPLGENAGLYGGVALVTDYLLSPALVDAVCLR